MPAGASALADAALGMAATLAHRGPDDSGVWVDAAAGVALSHRRLSVLDLSPEGHQPMASACGRYVLSYNGEVYNHAELRARLEGAGERFRGTSDSEVLLAALARWGTPGALGQVNGMFAFALWDRHDRRLTLARDRLGKKPLYYGRVGPAFAFASQLFALRTLPGFDASVDRTALSLFLRYGYVPAPYAMHRGIHKLPPGCVLELDAAALAPGAALPAPHRYWSCAQAAQAGRAAPITSPQPALDALDALLTDATALRLTADVPLGAFLSGGVDSSLVVALMQRQAGRPVRTFALGFDDPRRDETPWAAAVARHLGTDHTELVITDTQLHAAVPGLVEVFDEPLADLAQVPNLLIAERARQDVTVVLSGDGGDELFGGYDRYWDVAAQWARVARLPAVLRAALGAACARAGIPAAGAASRSIAQLYDGHLRHWEKLALGGTDERLALADAADDAPAHMMLFDQTWYLPDAILVKVDRTSMAHALEVRSPLLDYRVAELSWRLPSAIKAHDGRGKWPLRALLARHLPASLIDRPKRGFGAPVGTWVTGPLRDWAEDLLSEDRLRRQGLIDPAPVRRLWRHPHPGQRGWQKRIWCVLMLQAWLDASRNHASFETRAAPNSGAPFVPEEAK